MASKGDRIRERILTSAADIFYRQGYAETPFSGLARDSGIPKGNYYYYYKTKDAILEDVLEHRMGLIRTQLLSWEKDCHSPRECIGRFIAMLRDNAPDLSRYGCPIGSINTELGKSRKTLQSQARQLIELYVDWLAQQLGQLFDPVLARQYAMHLMVLAEGAALMGHVYGESELIIAEADRMQTWLDSLLADQP